jgi:RNase H-fold protein (predicted Holliday junction resolvase)
VRTSRERERVDQGAAMVLLESYLAYRSRHDGAGGR